MTTEKRPSSCDTARAAPVYTGDPAADAMMDFLDRKADAWMEETDIVSATHAMCALFGNRVPRELLAKFRRSLEAHMHLSFVEGAYRTWEEISEQQRALGHPLPPLCDSDRSPEGIETPKSGSTEGESAGLEEASPKSQSISGDNHA